MSLSGVSVLGYHGCAKPVADAAVAGAAPLRLSENEYDWLGHGIYFWENDPKRALTWAQGRDFENPAVVGAAIDLGYCLDLTEAENLQLVRASYDSLKRAYELNGVLGELPKNQPGYEGDQDSVKRNLDCMVINNLHRLREKNGEQPFDTVRSPFIEGSPLYPGTKFKALTHTQICVRDLRQIVGYFSPLF